MTPDASSLYQDSLPVHPDALCDAITALGLEFENFHHAPLRTVEDSKGHRDGFLTAEEGGGHIKNLYLRDKKKRNYLAVIQEDKEVDLKQLADQLEAQRLSFGSADRLLENLGVRPGAVTPLAMMHGAQNDVILGLDADLLSCKRIYMHPLVNDRTIAMSPDDLVTFLAQFSITPISLSL